MPKKNRRRRGANKGENGQTLGVTMHHITYGIKSRPPHSNLIITASFSFSSSQLMKLVYKDGTLAWNEYPSLHTRHTSLPRTSARETLLNFFAIKHTRELQLLSYRFPPVTHPHLHARHSKSPSPLKFSSHSSAQARQTARSNKAAK